MPRMLVSVHAFPRPRLRPGVQAALGGDAFVGHRNEEVMRLFADTVTGHVFHAGHDLAEEVLDLMAAVVADFLASVRVR